MDHRHITSKYPANQYVGIDQSITYGSKGTVILSKTSGIVDTGTTLILLSTCKHAEAATYAEIDVQTSH